MRYSTVMLVAVTAMAILPGLSMAQPADVNADLRQAASRVAAGTHSEADLALVLSVPEVAAAVPDPDQPVETGVTRGKLPAQPLTAADGSSTSLDVAAGCWWIDRWWKRRSTLGFTIYDFHRYYEWCGSGTRVTRVVSRYDYLTEIDPIVVNIRERTVDFVDAVPRSGRALSHIQRRVELSALKVGCYATVYPQSRLWGYPNGHSEWTGNA